MPPISTPSKAPAQYRDDGADLAHSLRHLSLASKSPNSPAANRSPSSMSVRSTIHPRSPLSNRSESRALSTRPESRAGTPALLRKASLNSVRPGSANGTAPLRRASSVHMSPSVRSPLAGSRSSPEERPPPPTAASVASDYFKCELSSRHGETPDPTTETVVILHDSCYGHRYSRPRTSKASLSTIVERPERIKASALGVAAAYVRLGERHADGENPIHAHLDPISIPSIPFRIQKTARKLPLLSQTVTNVHGAKWMEELKIMCEAAEAKLAMNGKELQRPDINRGAGEEPPRKFHEGDLYLCAESLDAFEGALGGVCEAVDAVFQPLNPARRAFVAIRPPGHHCSSSHPSGFCWINNVHVGIMHAILSHGLTHAAIVDFDLHHGDGSQAIAWAHNSRGVGLSKNAAWWKRTSIGYFSVHDINSYPCEGGDEEKVKNASLCIEGAHGQNIWNVHLQPWKTETEFWALYESRYCVLLDKARDFLRAQTERLRATNQNAKGAIFISAGFDASEWEGAGMQRHNVNVPTEFYARLTRDIVKIAAEEDTSVDGRVISVLEGGYSDRALCSGILSHLSGLAGEDAVPTMESQYNGLGYEMGQRFGPAGGRARGESISSRKSDTVATPHPYEADWWRIAELERLEATIVSQPPPEPRKPRNTTPPTYSSPTQASQARAVATASPKLRRSASNMSLGIGSPISRAPTPPPPDVDWAVAAHELSKLLIPTNRTTGSCRHEDLSAEATRQRRDRQSMAQATAAAAMAAGEPPVPVPVAAQLPTRMGLRERKTTKSYLEVDEDDADDLDRLAKNRRQTVAGVSVLAAEKAAARGAPQHVAAKPRQTVRRLSAASTIVTDAADRAPPPLVAPLAATARPTTSLSVRPESSASFRAPTPAAAATGTLPPKKSRVPVVAKPEGAAKTARGIAKKAATVGAPKRGVSSSGPNSASSSAVATPTSVSPPSSGTNSAAVKAEDDLDNITSGMKKIKINLITPAQREARARAEQKRAAEAAEAQKFDVKAEAPRLEQARQETTPLPSPQLQGGPLPVGSPLFISPPQVQSQTQMQSSSSSATSPIQPTTPDVFIPFQPEGPTPESVAAHQQQLPLQWVPHNTTETPSPMKRNELPMFTSKSKIPFAAVVPPARSNGGSKPPPPAFFAPPSNKAPELDDEVDAEGDEETEAEISSRVWEVPRTPRK